MTLQARETPCGSCPYRRDCPSGVWDETEYAKLVEYDRITPFQPTAVFMCHSNRDDVTLCRGWLDTHNKDQSLALRLAASQRLLDYDDIVDLPKSAVPTFASGQEAAEHGMAEIEDPSPAALAFIAKLAAHLEGDL